ncbi:MAG: hypothetical protein KDK61_06675, partial [Simkania sp.]|nr:hypothetical protein [Simkania sp.]
YPRSAITRGVDLPDVNLVIVDCAHFIPQSAIGTLKEGMSKEEKRLELAKDIPESLTQICGRVLRSNEKREPGRTVRDERKIVILLHNLPNELQGFELNQSLVHNQREFTQFVRTRKRGTVESVASAISVSLDGGDPEQVTQETIKEEIKERYKEGGNENISIKDRGLISEEDRRKIKVAKKVEKLKAKIIDGKEKGFSKREVMNNCNLSRFFKDYKEKIEEVSSFLDEVFK